MKKVPKLPSKAQSLIKVAQTDGAFKKWAELSGIATSKEIDSLPKANMMRLYSKYLKELKAEFPRMRDDMMGMTKN